MEEHLLLIRALDSFRDQCLEMERLKVWEKAPHLLRRNLKQHIGGKACGLCHMKLVGIDDQQASRLRLIRFGLDDCRQAAVDQAQDL